VVGPAVALALGLAAFSAPPAAQAAYPQYALYYPAHESTPKYSAVATVRGGKAYPDSGIVRMYIQTMSGSYLVASAYGAAGTTVTLSHVPYNNSKSRCYWDYVGGTIPGGATVPINCWRLS
jgi:hypothetical protein